MQLGLGSLEMVWPGRDYVFRIQSSRYTHEIAQDVALLRMHYDGVESEDAIDRLSYHIVGYLADQPIICIRVTLARDAPIESREHYWQPALDLAYPHISSGGRFYIKPGVKLPKQLRDTFHQSYIALSLRLGSMLEVSNCPTRGGAYYERMGFVVDRTRPFIHALFGTPSFPIYLPACPDSQSVASPLMGLATRFLARSELLRALALEPYQVQARTAANSNAAVATRPVTAAPAR